MIIRPRVPVRLTPSDERMKGGHHRPSIDAAVGKTCQLLLFGRHIGRQILDYEPIASETSSAVNLIRYKYKVLIAFELVRLVRI
jgi:hypothetical protein